MGGAVYSQSIMFTRMDVSMCKAFLTLLLESLNYIADCLDSTSARLLCHWIARTSVATYIFDSSVLVDLALQVLENALAEKRVCRHDVWLVVCCLDVQGCWLPAEVELQKVRRWSNLPVNEHERCCC